MNRAVEVLSPHLKPETVNLLDKVKPTSWGEHKTDGIDFNVPFIWLDDDLWPDEEKVLKANNAVDSFILIDLLKNPDQLKDIFTKQIDS